MNSGCTLCTAGEHGTVRCECCGAEVISATLETTTRKIKVGDRFLSVDAAGSAVVYTVVGYGILRGAVDLQYEDSRSPWRIAAADLLAMLELGILEPAAR